MILKLKTTFLGVLALSIISCQSGTSKSESSGSEQDTSQTTAAEDEGWVSLFDGKTTNGWHTYGKSVAGAAWEVDNGTLHLNIKDKNREDRGDLVTDKEYENYHLKLEWKISEGGNSGIIFNVHEDTSKYGATYQTGPEMQVLDNDKHADGKIHKHRAGDLYDLIASSEETAKPVGEWNLAEVIVNNGKLDFYLNGVNLVSTTMFDDNWKEMVAGSKFATMPGFGIYKKGKIALQDHNDEVWYRNIMIKEL
jgi:hypothetical protein